MKFTQQFLDELDDEESVEVIETEQVCSSRWSSFHETIFKFDSHYYKYEFTNGLTEYQENERLAPEEEIECEEVFPTNVMITVYKTVEEIDNALADGDLA